MWSLKSNALPLVLGALGHWVAPPVPQAVTASRAPVDVLAYRLSIHLFRGSDSFDGAARITLVVDEEDAERVGLDFVGLDVDSVKVDGTGTVFHRDGGKLEVELGRRAAAGDTVVVEVHYGGVPNDGLIIRRNAHGAATVFADNWPNRARYWFPGVDHPSDKALVEFRVRAPAEWRVVANGRLASEEELGSDEKLTVWASDHPIPVYTMVIGAAEMSVREVGTAGCGEDDSSCVRITQWSYPEDEERASRLFRRAPEIVAFFDSLIGPFPYEKLALVQTTTRFGGMENSSAIFFTERLGGGRSGDGLVVHEIAHQWFGDAVTEREWPHLWLSEGFATYFTSIFFEFVEGDTTATRLRAGTESRYMASARDVGRPVIDAEPEDLFELLNGNNYQKGAWVLHMLRRVVGDRAFFDGVRGYYTENLHGTALTADLRHVMEQASGQELGWFFEQWLYRPGYPNLEVKPTWDADANVLLLSVLQRQGQAPFRVPLEVVVQGAGYEEKRTFWVEKESSEFDWALPAQPTRITVDPENSVLGLTELVE